MIRFSLRCANDHAFESWFQSNTSYDKLAAGGQITCPHCGSAAVKKAPMAPAIRTSSAAAAKREPVGADAAHAGRYTTQELSVPADPAAARMLELSRRIRARLATEADYVGRNFATEARDRHDKASDPDAADSTGDITRPERPIWGEASVDEARELIEDGIAILPVPSLPEDRN